MSAQHLDGAVLLTGESIDAVRFAVRVTIAARHRNGQRVPREIACLARELSVFGHPATEPEPILDADNITTEEAANMLGISNRQARRLAPQLGGRLISGRWTLDRRAVTDYLQNRTAA
ncbi:hypothetical protein NJ76_21765 [Rhodococcus sp. IITR03]|nr:hypothetical protein NJ76_21765 [Rhodococcus sp. IITR03]